MVREELPQPHVPRAKREKRLVRICRVAKRDEAPVCARHLDVPQRYIIVVRANVRATSGGSYHRGVWLGPQLGPHCLAL
eukprot:6300731-Prymnesium_polylepis.1